MLTNGIQLGLALMATLKCFLIRQAVCQVDSRNAVQKPPWQDMGVFQITPVPYLDSDQKDVGRGGGVHEGVMFK